MKIYAVQRTVFSKINKTVENGIEFAFKTKENAKEYLKGFTKEDAEYRLDADGKILIWKGEYNTYYREIIEVDLM